MNKVILIGRLTRDPEIRVTPSGISCCTFTVACDRRFADQNGNRQADFLNCVAWRERADFVSKYFAKGRRIGLEGSIQTRSYEKDGQNRTATEILVDNVEFVENKPQPQQQPESAIYHTPEPPSDVWQSVPEEKLPF